MPDKYLPIGTVVILKNASKRVMITGFCAQDNNNKGVVFDYSACLFPEGILSSDQMGLFNHDQIDRIIFKGLEDEEVKTFIEKLKKITSNESQDTESSPEAIAIPKINNIDSL